MLMMARSDRHRFRRISKEEYMRIRKEQKTSKKSSDDVSARTQERNNGRNKC